MTFHNFTIISYYRRPSSVIYNSRSTDSLCLFPNRMLTLPFDSENLGKNSVFICSQEFLIIITDSISSTFCLDVPNYMFLMQTCNFLFTEEGKSHSQSGIRFIAELDSRTVWKLHSASDSLQVMQCFHLLKQEPSMALVFQKKQKWSDFPLLKLVSKENQTLFEMWLSFKKEKKILWSLWK